METAAVEQMQQTVQNSHPTSPDITKPENPQPQNPLEKLDEIHQYATVMRSKLVSYKIITEKIRVMFERQYNEESLRHWFEQGGSCYEALQFVKERNKKIREEFEKEAANHMKIMADSAFGVIQMAIDGESVSDNQLAAAKDILDRAGYPKVSKQQMEGQIESTGLTETAKALKAIASSLHQSSSKKPAAVVKPVVNTSPAVVSPQQPQGGVNGQS